MTTPTAALMTGKETPLILQVAPEHQVSKEVKRRHVFKATVVGCGNVGVSCAQSLITQGVVTDLALVDVKEAEKKLQGEVLDLQHGVGTARTPFVKISGSTSYAVSQGSHIVIITAGVRQKEGESRTQLLQRNERIVESIVRQAVEHSPDALLLVATNPVDLMTYVAQKVSGLPPHRVIGTGTTLDSARFRQAIGHKLEVNPHSVHAYMIGEHGDSCVPVWSAVTVGGVHLKDAYPELARPAGKYDKPNEWQQLSEGVVKAAYEVIRLKGYTSFGIGLSVSAIVAAVARNEDLVLPLSTLVPKGLHGIPDATYLSLPCIINRDGIKGIIKQQLDEQELSAFRAAAFKMLDLQSKLAVNQPKSAL